MNLLRSTLSMVAAGGLLLCVAAPAFAAPKSYQITGTISAMDDTTLTIVTRTKETWLIGRDASTKLPDGAKVGDKVKVNYTMVAGEVTPPDAATAATKKSDSAPAKASKKAKADTAAPASGSPSKPAAEAASPTP